MPKALLLLGVLAVAGAAHGAGRALPPPILTAAGYTPSIAASGPALAFSTGCSIRLLEPARPQPVTVKTSGVCGETDWFVDQVWLGRSAVGAELYNSPSPHGEAFAYATGPRAGPLREQGEWGWQDSEEPYGSGCRWVVAAGGGVIAAATIPHRLAYDHGLEQDEPFCPSTSTRVRLAGAASPGFAVDGVWSPLGTDGKRVLLAGRDRFGERTGDLQLFDTTGAKLPAPRVDPQIAKRAFRAWLAPEGLVLETSTGITAPGWSVKQGGDVTVAEGRVLYVKGRALHARRIRGGPDRVLATLPRSEDYVALAAGSFGLAIAVPFETGSSGGVKLYRLSWRTIDRTVTAG